MSNSISTFEREIKDADLASDIVALAIDKKIIQAADFQDTELIKTRLKENVTELNNDLEELWHNYKSELVTYEQPLSMFRVDRYIHGIDMLHQFHIKSTGKI